MTTETKTRILVADDEEYLKEALGLFLKTKGYETVMVSDGTSAIARLKEESFEILLTDLHMPGMSGEQLIEFINSDKGPTDKPAIIVMTAHSSVDSVIKGIGAGVSAYIRKPLNLHELDAAIKTAVERRRLENKLKRYYRELDQKVEERTRELSMLISFSEKINRSLDLDSILNDAVVDIVRCLDTDAAWIYLQEEGETVIRLKAQAGLSPSLAGHVSVVKAERWRDLIGRDGSGILSNNGVPNGLPISRPISNEGFTSAVHAAVRSRDKVLGMVGVASNSGKVFNEAQLQLLASLGNQIGVAVEKIRLYEKEKATSIDLQKKVNQFFILNLMGSRARVSQSAADTASMLVTSVIQALGFDNVCLWLFDESSTILHAASCQGKNCKGGDMPISVDGTRLAECYNADGEAALANNSICGFHGEKMDEGLVAVAPLVTRDLGNREIDCWEHLKCGRTSCPAYHKKGISCWMVSGSCQSPCAPEQLSMLDKIEHCKGCEVYKTNTRGRIVGVFCSDNRATRKKIDTDDIKVLNIFANAAASILNNIQLMERLIKNERFIDGIILNMASGLLVAGLDGRVKLINIVGAQIFGCDTSDVEGKDIRKLFPEAARMLIMDHSALGHDISVKTRNGVVPVGYTNSYLTDPAGNPEGVIVVFRDLSDIKKLHEQLRERDHFAAIGKVAAGVAHEIRNPLFGITSVAQIIARDMAIDNPKRALVDAMLSETSRLNTLVEEMLLYGRSMKLSTQPVNLNTLIDSVLLFHQAGLTEKGIVLIREFDDHLPDVMVDPSQLRQVFLNVIMNSLDASEIGGTIKIKTERDDEFAAVRIIDNGSGIPANDLSKVFDLFYTTKEKGTGLGLAICRKIIQDHGGSVNITSGHGEGTTINLLLPISILVNA